MWASVIQNYFRFIFNTSLRREIGLHGRAWVILRLQSDDVVQNIFAKRDSIVVLRVFRGKDQRNAVMLPTTHLIEAFDHFVHTLVFRAQANTSAGSSRPCCFRPLIS